MDARIRRRRPRLRALLGLVLLLWGSAAVASPHAEALLHLRADDLPPDARDLVIQELGMAPGQTEALIEILDPAGPLDSRRIGSRIAALRALLLRSDPATAPALATVFIRSRLGSLPEDPDLFERALRGLLAFPPEVVEAALIEGMLPVLSESAHEQLMDRWVRPLGGTSPAVAAMNEWMDAEQATLLAELTPLVVTAVDRHGEAWAGSFSTHGGSGWTPLVHRLQARIVAAWLTDHRPEVVRLAAEITVGLEQGWPELHAAVNRATESAPPSSQWTAAREALDRARSGLPAAQAWPELEPPASAPGHNPGLEFSSPQTSTSPTLLRTGPSSPVHRNAGLLLLMIGAGLFSLRAGIRASGPRSRRGWALMLGLSVLLSMEFGLRLAGLGARAEPLFRFTGFDAAPLEARDRSGETWLETPGGSMRHQVFAPQPTGDRVVVLGASSVHGSHYLIEEAFPAQLEQGLQDAGHDVEVLNMGIGGTLSDGIRSTGLQALENGADLLIIYYGHNEVGQFVQLSRFQGVDPDHIAVQVAVSRSAIGRLLQGLLQPSTDGSLSDAGEAIFSSQPATRQAVDRLKALAVHNYRWNLSLLLEAAGRRGVPVILCQVATNYRFSHLNPIEEAGPGDQEDLDRLVEQAEAQSQAGQHAEARASWQQAIDRSASPREVSSSIQQATADLAEAYGVTLVDVREHFYQGSPDGLSVSGLFWDDLHPTAAGHAVIAEALVAPAHALLGGP